jgi:signal transduction histidine kinase
VFRAATSEALVLANADAAIVAVRASSFDVAEIYEMRAGAVDVSVRKGPLPPELTSMIERARESKSLVTIDRDDPLGRYFGATAAIGSLDVGGIDIALILTWQGSVLSTDERSLLADFAENLATAVQQARLFIRLAEQNDAIVRTQRELEERSSVIRDLVYALAHDLRTPLAAADMTMTQALAGAYGELPERYRTVLRSSIISNADLRRLVETLLLVARYEAGEDARAFAVHDLNALVHRVAREVAPVAQAKRVLLQIDDVPAQIDVMADGDELRRAITNLTANAIEATQSGGLVRVRLGRDETSVFVEVIDNGFGVPPERRSALFQRFGGLRGGAGTGLGLYIVRRIAEKYGGYALYEPREPRGSRFSIVLPASIVANA